MDNVYEISMLLDFYGQLLTPKQHEILDFHYNNDYSLGEIAEELGISRQAVFDNIKRGKATLFKMEEKLGLVLKFTAQKEKAQVILDYIHSINKDELSSKDREKLIRIEETVQQLKDG